MYSGTVLKCYLSSVGVKRYNEDHGQSRTGDTSDPAEPPGQTTTLLAESRTSKSSSQRPLRSILAS